MSSPTNETEFSTPPVLSRSNTLFGIHTDEQLVSHTADQAAFGAKRETCVPRDTDGPPPPPTAPG